MSSTRELTGGSGDLNPQLLRFPGMPVISGGPTAIATYTLPVVLTPQQSASSQRIQLMELLKMEVVAPVGFDNSAQSAVANDSLTTEMDYGFQVSIGTHTDYLDADDDDILFQEQYTSTATVVNIGTPNGTQTAWAYNGPSARHVKDFTDGAGHGILLAAPTMTFAAFTEGMQLEDWSLEILFRLKDAPVNELLGLVLTQFGS
jgi:hypothetical protein